jgi:serpin B
MKSNQRYSLLLVSILVVGLAAGCSGVPGIIPEGSDSELMASKLPRKVISDLPLADLQDLSSGNTAFAFNLFQQLRDQSGNLFFSPYSISAALAMTYAGARGETAAEMADTLHFPLAQDQPHSSFNDLDQYLASLADREIPQDMGDPFQLKIANAIWGQKDYHFEAQFLDTLAENYGAGLRLLDFILEPEESRQTINDWVSQETQEKIRDLIPQGAINSDTRLVLSNAIYFKAAWQDKFEQSLTQDEIFHGLEGDIQVPMMKTASDASLPYYQGDGFQAVELPYVGGDVSLLVVLPDLGSYPDFEKAFDPGTLDEVLQGLTYAPVILSFPKFEFESEISLAQTLGDMGMPQAVSQQADFSGMTGAKDLFISDVFHKAYIKVDEEGTEAAAATAVIMTLTSAPANPIELRVDRPFLFLIREHQTDTILFLGRVVRP